MGFFDTVGTIVEKGCNYITEDFKRSIRKTDTNKLKEMMSKDDVSPQIRDIIYEELRRRREV